MRNTNQYQRQRGITVCTLRTTLRPHLACANSARKGIWQAGMQETWGTHQRRATVTALVERKLTATKTLPRSSLSSPHSSNASQPPVVEHKRVPNNINADGSSLASTEWNTTDSQYPSLEVKPNIMASVTCHKFAKLALALADSDVISYATPIPAAIKFPRHLKLPENSHWVHRENKSANKIGLIDWWCYARKTINLLLKHSYVAMKLLTFWCTNMNTLICWLHLKCAEWMVFRLTRPQTRCKRTSKYWVLTSAHACGYDWKSLNNPYRNCD